MGFCAAVREESEDQCPLLLEEDLDHVLWEPSGEASVLVVQTVPEEQIPCLLSSEPPSRIQLC